MPASATPAPGPTLPAIPELRATAIAQDPELAPPAAHPRSISRTRAIAITLRNVRAISTPAATASARVTARLMTIRPFERLLGEGTSFTVNVHRELWIVTVHARIEMSGGVRPAIYGVYTQVIDAATGQAFMASAGCDPFS